MSGTKTINAAYSYAAVSALHGAANNRGSELALATSGGATEAGPAPHPYFYSGFLADSGPAAYGLLAVAAVARTSYLKASRPRSIDPVVTSNRDTLRFESFSGCCGVHARLDLPPGALDGEPTGSGTTNVDFNPPMRAALGVAAAAGGPILLKVGDGEVTAVTETGSVTERKVPLPARWVKGFGEVQALARDMPPVAELTGPAASRFLSSLPRGSRGPLWAYQAGKTLALSTVPRPGAACLATPERLGELRPLLRFATALRVYAPPADGSGHPAPSAWELTFGAARLTLTLSPAVNRGFSGEGALLDGLAAADAGDEDLLAALLPWDALLDPGRLSTITNLSSERITVTLPRLAASGRVGYDLAEQAFFRRELPFTVRDGDHPRLRNARALVAEGKVTLTPGGAEVVSGGADPDDLFLEDNAAPPSGHRVTFASPYDTCTCRWWGKHQGTRGPCKHVLAARIVSAEAAV